MDHDTPWVPISKPIDLKCLSKLIEECGELTAIAGRCIAQGGLDKIDPDTGVINKDAIQDEIADIIANTALIIEHFDLDNNAITHRIVLKVEKLKNWHKSLET